MGTVIQKQRKLDFNKINSRVSKVISTEESLKNIAPIRWNQDVLSGNKKVIITKAK